MLLAIAMMFALAACDESSKADGNAQNGAEEEAVPVPSYDESGKEDGNAQDSAEGEFIGMRNNDFEDVGNSPANFWSNQSSLAFDDNFIYFIAGTNIKRMDYSGQNIADVIDADKPSHLNAYGRYIYYADRDDSRDTRKLCVFRVDTSTFVKECLYSYSLPSNTYPSLDAESLLVTGGYAFFAMNIDNMSGSKSTKIVAIDVSVPEKTHLIYSEGNCRGVALTSDNERNVYAFIKTDGSNSNERAVYKINIDDIGDYSSFNLVLGGRKLGIMFGSCIPFANGIAMCYDDGYRNYYYSNITDKWTYGMPDGKDEGDYAEFDEDANYTTLLLSGNQRFVLGNSLVILATDGRWTNSDYMAEDDITAIWFCKDMDFANPMKLGEIRGFTLFSNDENNRFGAYNDILYMIAPADGALYTIDENGSFNRVN